jgi:uncharacterized protein DUF6510
MNRLDGNALAGALSELFSVDLTAASGRCSGCGTTAVLATAVVYAGEQGTVARCATCDHVLATIVESDDRTWFSLAGLRTIEVRR